MNLFPIYKINKGGFHNRGFDDEITFTSTAFTDQETLRSRAHWSKDGEHGWHEFKMTKVNKTVYKYEMSIYRNAKDELKTETCFLKEREPVEEL